MLGIPVDRLLEILCAARKGYHAGPVGCKAAGKSPADPTAGSGDEDDFSLQDHGHATSHVCSDDYLETNGVCNSPRLKQPNARRQPLGRAGATQERTLFPVGWTPLLG